MTESPDRPVMSVVIPAHDEAAVIGRLLDRLIAGDREQRLELVVVANGCTDATAEVAASADPRVRVVEIPTASKPAALNAGDAAATVFPRAYVDADVRLEAGALLAVAELMAREPGVLAASPTLSIDLSHASRAVRLHYRIWSLSDYRREAHLGSGVYVLSQAGRARFGAFPSIIADDRYVQQLFTVDERRSLPDHTFSISAPATLAAEIARSTRIAAGNAELRRAGLVPEAQARAGTSSPRALLGRVARRPRLWPALAVYCYGKAVPRVRARLRVRAGLPVLWNRDESSRV
ncbi:glycosyltransferase [Gryllotalpicola koreensis]|uniref:4,4'-diaponeurosporenoate glycosyltransferase n=1 Tax=Gryllotalpicola koreensis TaxID=993086 RepID=A0ABP7ZTW0_9MICO